MSEFVEPQQPQASGGTIETHLANRLAAGGSGSVTIAGQVFRVGQPTDADMATLGAEAIKIAARMRQSILCHLLAPDSAFPCKSLAEAKEIQADLFPVPDPKTREGLQAIMFEPEGTAFLAWLLARKEDATVTLADLRAVIDQDNASAVAMDLLAEAGLLAAVPFSGGATGSSAPSGATRTAAPSTAS